MAAIGVSWQPLVWSGGCFTDFQPYVPAVDDSGAVLFQAATAGGGSGVYAARGSVVETLFSAAPDETVCSHPDGDSRAEVCVYLSRSDGSSALVIAQGGRCRVLADSRDGVFAAIGPLGPVMDAGVIAFRATLADGRAAVCEWSLGGVQVLARAGDDYAAFHGLPVVAGAAGVLFRADRSDGTQGLYRAVDGRVMTVFEGAADAGTLALFPSMNAAGEVACGWSDAAGEARVLRIRDGREPERVATGALRFQSLRGCLLSGDGQLCFTGTSCGGKLGVYRVTEQGVSCLLEEGAAVEGARVQGFALNPVSINAAGRVAARVLLDDGRQLIVVSGCMARSYLAGGGNS